MVKSKGITLVEVLVALLLFSVGMLASGLIALKSLSLAREGLNQIKAIDLAQMQQEAVMIRGTAVNIQAWQERIRRTLPQGEGRIIQSQGSNGESHFIVQVSWQPNFKKAKRREVSL